MRLIQDALKGPEALSPESLWEDKQSKGRTSPSSSPSSETFLTASLPGMRFSLIPRAENAGLEAGGRKSVLHRRIRESKRSNFLRQQAEERGPQAQVPSPTTQTLVSFSVEAAGPGLGTAPAQQSSRLSGRVCPYPVAHRRLANTQ